MKKKLLLLLVATVIGIAPNMIKAEKWSYGVEAGMNFSTLSECIKDTYNPGATFNLMAEYSFKEVSNTFFLKFGLGLTLDTYKSYITNKDGKYRPDVRLSPWSLYIPVHIGYRFKLSNDFSMHATVGPYFKYGLFGPAKSYDPAVMPVQPEHYSNLYKERMLERDDLGIGIGVGVSFKKHYRLDFVYNYGIFSVLAAGDSPYFFGDERRAFAITLGYMF